MMARMMNIRPLWGKFSVSDAGDVFSGTRKLTNSNIKGYRFVSMRGEDGVKRMVSVHRLVASTFIANPENKPEVNHKDGDRWNARVANLEWVTAKENTAHAIASGLSIVNAAPSLRVIEAASRLRDGGATYAEIARELGVSISTAHGYVSRSE